MDKNTYTHRGRGGAVSYFDIAEVKKLTKSEFEAAHSHISGAGELYHIITGFPKEETQTEKPEKPERPGKKPDKPE